MQIFGLKIEWIRKPESTRTERAPAMIDPVKLIAELQQQADDTGEMAEIKIEGTPYAMHIKPKNVKQCPYNNYW